MSSPPDEKRPGAAGAANRADTDDQLDDVSYNEISDRTQQLDRACDQRSNTAALVAVKLARNETIAALCGVMRPEGRRRRARREVAPRPKEIVLQMQVADLLRRFARIDWRWSHFPAGEHRDVRTAAKLKAMGTQPGLPDFILFCPTGQLHALELKRVGEGLSDKQLEFAAWCAAQGVPHAVARTLDQASDALGCWGALRVTLAGNMRTRT